MRCFSFSGARIYGVAWTSAAASTKTSSFDTANRITTSGYTYDQLGRTLTAPQADLATGDSALTVTYYDTDLPRSMSQTVNGATRAKTFTLDPAGRYRQVTDTTSGSETRRIRNRYTDGGDSPAWIETSNNSGATWTWERNITGIDGNLAATHPDTGTPTLQITNLHGDIVATVPNHTPTSADPSGATTTSYFENTEYGTPRDTTLTGRYAWLGAHRRSTDTLAGIVLMGVRLYNPTTGRFLSTDPVPGGNENAYNYPNDPINNLDLDGRWSWRGVGRHLKNHWRGYASAAVFGVCVVASAGACAVAGGIAAGANYIANGRRYGWGSKRAVGGAAADVAWTATGFGVGRGLGWFASRSVSRANRWGFRKYVRRSAFRYRSAGRHRTGGTRSVVNWRHTTRNVYGNALGASGVDLARRGVSRARSRWT